MLDFLNAPRSATASGLCQPASSTKSTRILRLLLPTAVKDVLSEPLSCVSPRSIAIGLPQSSGMLAERLDDSNKPKISGRAVRRRSTLAWVSFALLTMVSYAVAGAQTATTTTLTVTPATAAYGAALNMTAIVKAGATPLTGGTVTFRDTFNAVTQVLGTVQVQSANGTKGSAVLVQQLGGIGTHSIVATFNATSSYSTSSSASKSVSITGLYPTTASLGSVTGVAGNWSLTTTVVGAGSKTLSPTGNVSLVDTSNSNFYLGMGGLGAGTIAQQTVAGSTSPVGVGNSPQGVAAGDFDGDGFIDLAVVNSGDDNISILIGDGAGGFTASATKYATGDKPIAIVAGDFNGDGNLDLATANANDGTISILLGNGDGTFKPRSTYSLPNIASVINTTPTDIAIGDFNGDGIPDLIVSGTYLNGVVDVMLGDGTGAFPSANLTQVTVGNGPSSVAVGDFNGDGKLDFAVTNQSDRTISVMKGSGNGTTFTQFAAAFSTGAGSSPSSIVAADFNGDGKLDLAVAESGLSRIGVFTGVGNGTFGVQATYATGNAPSALVVGDFNSDGIADIGVTNNNTTGTVSLLLGTGTGTFLDADDI